MRQMEKMDSEAGDRGHTDSVYNALCRLLTYVPLLDIVDTNCKSVHRGRCSKRKGKVSK